MASTITDRVAIVVPGGAISAAGFGVISCFPVTGTADLIEAETTPAISGYLANQLYMIRPVLPNTGPVDINLSQRGFVSVLKPNGDELAADEFHPNLEYILKFNGDEMRVITPSF
jgi:hypothetical protein